MLERNGNRAQSVGTRLARAATAYLALAGLVLVAACSTTGGLFGGGSRTEAGAASTGARSAVSSEAPAAVDTGGLAVYLDMMQRLIEGDALSRAEVFNEARDAAEYAPTTTNRLKYALALSVPGHQGSDADAASERLRALIAAGDTLLPEERILATIQLRQADRLLILEDQNEDLRNRQAATLEAHDAEMEARIAELAGENAKLRQDLKETNDMLEALTSIEQSISEREDNEQ